MTSTSADGPERRLPASATWGRSLQEWEPAGAGDPVAVVRRELERARAEAARGRRGEARRLLERMRPVLKLAEQAAGARPSSRMGQLLFLGAAVLVTLAHVDDAADERLLYARALDLYVRAAEIASPDLSPDDRVELGLAFAQIGAFPYAEQLIEAAPPAGWIAMEMARAYERHGRPEAAAREYGRAAELDEGDGELQERVGEALARIGRPDEAKRAYYHAALVAASRGGTEEAQRLADRASALDPSDVDVIDLKADLLRIDGRPAEALRLLEPALIEHPEVARLHVTTSLCLLALERPDEALEAIRRARAVGSDVPGIAIAEALILSELGRLEESLLPLDEALAEAPDNAVALAAKADIQARLGRAADALSTIELALAIDPTLGSALILKASILRGNGDVAGALEAIRTAVEHAPDDPSALTELGDCLLASGTPEHLEEATAVLERALERTPDNAWVMASLGEAHVRSRRLEEGIVLLRRSIELQPSLAWPRDVLLQAVLDRKEAQEGLALANWLLDAAEEVGAPEHLRVRYLARRGEAYRILERYEDARVELERALDLDPEYPYALGTLGQVLLALERDEEAIERLRRAAAAAPASAWIGVELVRALIRAGALDEALDVVARGEDEGLERDTVLALLGHVRAHGGDRVPGALEAAVRRHPASPAVKLSHAAVLLDAGRFERALTAVDEVLELEDEPPDTAIAMRSAALRGLGRDAEADAAIDAVLARDPARQPLLHQKVEVLVGAGRVDEARDVLARAVQARPDRAELPLELARLLVEAGRPQEASEWFARAAEADPRPETVSATVRALSELGLRDDAVALLERLREGDRSPDLLVAIGTELQGLGRRDDALRAVDDAVARDGDHAGARVHRGMLLVELERPLDGLASFERVLRRADAGLVEDERSVHVAMAGKGWALSQLGSFEEALQWLNTALQRMPKVDFVSGLLGWVRQNLGRHDEALAAYHAARELDSKFVWYRKGVADCLVLLERPDEARPLFQALLEDSEATSTLGPAERFALHGWCHYRLRDFDAASESLVEALAIDSLLLSCQYDLALVTLLSGGARRGVAEYQRGIDAAGGRPQRAAGWLRVALKDLRDAGAEHRDLVSELPEYDRAERLLAAAYKEAAEALEREREEPPAPGPG